MTGSKRFISGAVCPSCQAVDRIVIETLAADEGRDPTDEASETQAPLIRRRCVACGFVEHLETDAATATAPLPRARYDRSRRTTDRVEVVKILDPGSAKDSS